MRPYRNDYAAFALFLHFYITFHNKGIYKVNRSDAKLSYLKKYPAVTEHLHDYTLRGFGIYRK
jgi:hypothetical protein